MASPFLGGNTVVIERSTTRKSSDYGFVVRRNTGEVPVCTAGWLATQGVSACGDKPQRQLSEGDRRLNWFGDCVGAVQAIG
ncbi:MAG: hypothetical protein FWF41_07320 [Betaproteobacteria bacterium]|nr:hypothetical protein [Betaproteobacteria bacterium]